jgi:hypothetical protein
MTRRRRGGATPRPGAGPAPIDIGSFRTTTVQQVYQYWVAMRQGDRLPSRADIKPEEIRPLLPYIFLIDVHRKPLRFQYRLIGTQICTWATTECTGTFLDKDVDGATWQIIFEEYRRTAETGEIGHAIRTAPWPGREFLVYERVVMPLAKDGVEIDMLLGALCVIPRSCHDGAAHSTPLHEP